MKQKFLLVSAALLLGVTTAFATVTERTQPELGEPQVPEFTDLVTDGTTPQYLYNVGLNRYLRGANDWMTRATGDSIGYPFKVTKLETGYYVLTDSVFKFSEWRNMFAASTDGIWVDNNTGANYNTWTITPVEGKKTFYIGNTAFANTCLGGIDGNIGTYNVNECTDIGIYMNLGDTAASTMTEGFKYEWAAVSVDEYLSKQPTVIYEASKPLYAILVEAETAGVPESSLEPYIAIYNDLNSTIKQMNEAVAAVRYLIDNVLLVKWQEATWDAPVDITSLIENLATDAMTGWNRKYSGSTQNGTFHVNTWSTEGNTDGTNMVTPFLEDWNAAGTNLADQVVYHDTLKIAPGAYKITINARCYNESAGAETLDGVSLFANFNKANLLKQADEVSPYLQNGTKLILWKDPFEVYAVVGTDSVLVFGLDIESANFNWLAFKDVHIYALGTSDDAVLKARDHDDCSIKELTDDDYVTVSLAEPYNEAAKKYLEGTTAADVMASVIAIKELTPAIEANMAAWKELYELYEAALKVVSDGNFAGQAVTDLNDYLENDLRDILGELTLNDAQIYEVIAKLTKMKEEAERGLVPGSKLAITNYDFASGENGWSFIHNDGGNVAANTSAKCAEAWNNSGFDIYEIKRGVPAGVYKLSVQGFYRYLRGENAWKAYFDEFGDKLETAPKSYAYAYLNDKRTALMNVFDYQTPVGELYTTTGDLAPYTDPLGTYWYPNDMTAAGQAFDQGAYTINAIGVVAHDGDSIRFGMKGSSNQGGDSWAIFTRFEIVYLGYDADSIRKELTNELANMNYGLIGKELQDSIAKIKAQADTVTDGMAMFNLLSALYALDEPIENSEAVFTELKSANEALGTTLSDETLNTLASIKEEAQTLYQTIDEAISAKSLTTAEAEEYLSVIKLTNKKLYIPANINEATDAAPVELTKLIDNNSFETGSTANWTNSGSISFNAQSNAAFGKDGTYYAERWHADGTLDMSQTIAGLPLPAGTYGITVFAHCSTNDGKLYANDKEADITNTTDATAPNQDTVYCKIENDGDSITFGVKATLTSSTWCCIDNFSLFYYGANSARETTGIAAITEYKAAVVEIYDMNGRKINALQKGINIVRTINSNGEVSVKKISIK